MLFIYTAITTDVDASSAPHYDLAARSPTFSRFIPPRYAPMQDILMNDAIFQVLMLCCFERYTQGVQKVRRRIPIQPHEMPPRHVEHNTYAGDMRA